MSLASFIDFTSLLILPFADHSFIMPYGNSYSKKAPNNNNNRLQKRRVMTSLGQTEFTTKERLEQMKKKDGTGRNTKCALFILEIRTKDSKNL